MTWEHMMNVQIAYISFVRPINWDTVNSLLNHCNQAINHGAKQLYLLVSSNGGLVDPGFAVYNQLRSLPVEVITHNIGSVDSTGNVVFLAGSKRFACGNATFLFHGIHWGFGPGAEIRRPQLMEIIAALKAAESKMMDLIVNRSSLSREEVDAFFTEGAMKDASFALSKSIIEEIKDVAIPPGVTVIQA
jgi:ATP-dependent protease ClpP protease subunit